MIRSLVVLSMLGLASSAHADSPKLEQARKAIDEVRFDDAQRLLVGALADGGNSPAAVREIYKLSASTAVVVGQREVGEQNYRRWIALDASASIGAGVAPKLREPFEAAQAYVAAHGRLTAVATRVSATVIDVSVTDPLAMAVSATIVGGTPVPLSTEHRAQLAPPSAGAVTVAVLDDRGNRLVEVTAGPAPTAPAVAGPMMNPVPEPIEPEHPEPEGKRFRVWIVFAVPSAVLLLTGVGFAYAASEDWATVNEAIADSTRRRYYDVEAKQDRATTFTALGSVALGFGVVLAVPALIFYARARNQDHQVVPVVGKDSAGVSLVGRF